MWWPDRRRRSARLALALAIAAATLGAGCQVRPLYLSEAEGGLLSPVPDLRAILINQPDSRVEQEIRNELLFLFRGDGSEVVEPRFRLRMLVTSSTNNIAVGYVNDLPRGVIVTVNVTFVLTEIDTEATLLTGSAVATASYDFSSQRFANVRAERDAETRAANSIAEQLNARIAAYFAARRSS
jgi:LPS-assembly lipoprotein